MTANQLKAYHKRIDHLVQGDKIQPSIDTSVTLYFFWTAFQFWMLSRLFRPTLQDSWKADPYAPVSWVIWANYAMLIWLGALFGTRAFVALSPNKEEDVKYWFYDRLGITTIAILAVNIIYLVATLTADWFNHFFLYIHVLVSFIVAWHFYRFHPQEPPRIKVKLKNGKVGLIYDFEFDSKTMTRV